jgi:hypothetical protein
MEAVSYSTTQRTNPKFVAILGFAFLNAVYAFFIIAPMTNKFLEWIWRSAVAMGNVGTVLAISGLVTVVTLWMVAGLAVFSRETREYCYGK